MKIAHISTQSSWRGGEQQIYYLHEELVKRKIDSVVLARSNSSMANRLSADNLPFEPIPFKSAYDLMSILKLVRFVNGNGVNILHAHTSKAHTMAIIATLLGMKAKIVLSRRVDVPIKNNWFSRFKYNHPSIKKIICVSDKIKEINTPGLEDPGMLTRVYSGIDLSKFEDRQKGKLKKLLGVDNDQILIGNVSALAIHKDFGTFVKVADYITKREPRVKFVIIGEGEERTKIEADIEKLGLNSHITLLGFREDVPDLIIDLDIFLFTSKTEGLGTTALDAIGAGVPLVATKAGGIPEIISRNNCGLLRDIGDVEGLGEACLEIIRDQNLKKDLVQKGRETITYFSKENTAKQTLAIYQSIL
jgi:glycosyltransferase involved in cell wall biosynthesis